MFFLSSKELPLALPEGIEVFFRNDWGVSDLKSCRNNRKPWTELPTVFRSGHLRRTGGPPEVSQPKPLKSYKNPIGKEVVFQAPIFQGRTVKTLGVYILTKRGGDEKCEPIRQCSSEPCTQNPLIEHGFPGDLFMGNGNEDPGGRRVSAEFTATIEKTGPRYDHLRHGNLKHFFMFTGTSKSDLIRRCFFQLGGSTTTFWSVIWKDHPFANATFMLMLYLKFLEPLSWKFCVYFVSFSIKSFFCQSNSPFPLRYPLPFPKKHTNLQTKADPSWRPYPRGDINHHPHPHPLQPMQPTNQPTDGRRRTSMPWEATIIGVVPSQPPMCLWGWFDGGCGFVGGKGEEGVLLWRAGFFGDTFLTLEIFGWVWTYA